jgi:hypothetical protein
MRSLPHRATTRDDLRGRRLDAQTQPLEATTPAFSTPSTRETRVEQPLADPPRRCLQEGHDVSAANARFDNPKLGISPGGPQPTQEGENRALRQCLQDGRRHRGAAAIGTDQRPVPGFRLESALPRELGKCPLHIKICRCKQHSTRTPLVFSSTTLPPHTSRTSSS